MAEFDNDSGISIKLISGYLPKKSEIQENYSKIQVYPSLYYLKFILYNIALCSLKLQNNKNNL